MTREELAKYFDHTFLKAFATEKDLEKLCDEALELNTAAVAINNAWVPYCRQKLQGSDVKAATCVGFPLGQSSLDGKLAECMVGLNKGAQEVDYVLDVGKVKEHDWDYIATEMNLMTALCHSHNAPVKVIFENCYLDKDEIKKLAQIAAEVKPDFIKTSTGFGTGGATVEDVRIMKENCGPDVKVKAAGGIRDLKTCLAMIEAGADRIGTSSAVKIMEEFDKQNA